MAASMAPIAKDFGIEKTPVALFGFLMPALVFALSLNRIFDGVGRPFFGWVSDQIGRENTMAIAFTLGALALFTLSRAGTTPVRVRAGHGAVLRCLRRDLQSLPGNPG